MHRYCLSMFYSSCELLLVVKTAPVGTFYHEIWKIFCSAIVLFHITSGFTLHSAIPVYGKGTSGYHPFVVAGGINYRVFREKICPSTLWSGCFQWRVVSKLAWCQRACVEPRDGIKLTQRARKLLLVNLIISVPDYGWSRKPRLKL